MVGFLPVPVQRLSHYVPTYYAVHALDREILYTTAEGIGRDFAVVGAVTSAALMLGIAVFRRQVLVTNVGAPPILARSRRKDKCDAIL